MAPPALSLIVPTRKRPAQLRQFLASIAATARHPNRIEIILVLDDDDESLNPANEFPDLTICSVVGRPGRTMGELNRAGYVASRGNYVMLLNDDVVVSTRGWDTTILKCFRKFPDPIALIHVNDTLIRDYLCTFPILSREYCELIGGICPAEYERYRIDDHIEDVFNILAFLGERRTIYLPDVIFEHRNFVRHPTAGDVYESDPAILARDAPRFEALLPKRKEQASRVLEFIEGGRDIARHKERLFKLDSLTDSFALRLPGRQHVVRASWWKRVPKIMHERGMRICRCYERAGLLGLAAAATRRAVHLIKQPSQ